MGREFNLIDEPWILVRTSDCKVKELSLKDVLLDAHEYVSLAGETKTQDFAILRLILAVMYTVFSRYDEDGNEVVYDNIDQAYDLWENIWKSGKIPPTPIEKYFEKWHDRFWLFDDEYPFYQSPEVNGKSAKPVSVSKMIGTLFESNNKNRFFTQSIQDNHGCRKLTYSEVTRWLIHLNCFDDIAAKSPTPKRTWVGKLGLIAMRGENLFETILLNYNPVIDVGKKSRPSWEKTKKSSKFNDLIAVPDNQAELLSLLSRCVFLCRENGYVYSYYVSGGEYFEENDVYIEQMTIWKQYREKKDSPILYKPEIHKPEKNAWREFSSIAEEQEGDRIPGVLLWIKELVDSDILPSTYMVNISTAAIVYDFNQMTCLPVIDSISDELTFNSELLLSFGKEWRLYICEEISKCDEAAKTVSNLSRNLQKAAGNTESKEHRISGDKVKQEFYNRIDRPFRIWLSSVQSDDDETEKLKEIETQIYRISLDLGNELVLENGSNAILGRYLKGEVCSSAEALNIYTKQIHNIFRRVGDEY